MIYDGNIEQTFRRLNDALKADDEEASREAALAVVRSVVECLARIAAAVEALASPQGSPQ
jgi:hypothetical protein